MTCEKTPKRLDGGESVRKKRQYRAPELVEWGAITEITQGPMGGIEDFPLGGTMGV